MAIFEANFFGWNMFPLFWDFAPLLSQINVTKHKKYETDYHGCASRI